MGALQPQEDALYFVQDEGGSNLVPPAPFGGVKIVRAVITQIPNLLLCEHCPSLYVLDKTPETTPSWRVKV